jgi:hypothetical protein
MCARASIAPRPGPNRGRKPRRRRSAANYSDDAPAFCARSARMTEKSFSSLQADKTRNIRKGATRGTDA